jgi:putative ABC transport system permease protein
LNARKREFGIYRALGAPRSRLVKLILCESSSLSLLGAAIGIAAAVCVVFPFSAYIGSLIGLPYLRPSWGSLFLAAAVSFLISFAVGPLASIYSALKLGRSGIYASMREEA